MFSGIIEELGQVEKISRRGNYTLLEIKSTIASQGAKIGDSIALNGVCLTVIRKKESSLSFEVMPETLKITNLGLLKIGDRINLERALKIGDRLSGHFVSGHVDCPGIIRKKSFVNNNLAFEIAIPQKFMANLILKGSIALDGISLTVAAKKSNTFSVYIIPHTLKNTTLGFKGPSSRVNLEFDLLAKSRI